MKIKKELIKREVAGDTILVPVGKTVYDTNGLFVLNEIGAFIWDRLEKFETTEEIVDAILEEYDAQRGEVTQDVEEFLEKFRNWGVI